MAIFSIFLFQIFHSRPEYRHLAGPVITTNHQSVLNLSHFWTLMFIDVKAKTFRLVLKQINLLSAQLLEFSIKKSIEVANPNESFPKR